MQPATLAEQSSLISLNRAYEVKPRTPAKTLSSKTVIEFAAYLENDFLVVWEDVSYFMLTLIPFTPKFSCSSSLVELHRLMTLEALPAFKLFVPTWKYFAMEGIFEK